LPTNDHETIRQIIARQAQLRDDDRIDEWIAAWADDGVFIAGDQRHEGRAAVLALANSLTTGSWRALHLLSEPYIEVDGNTATAETDLVIVAPSADGRLNIRAANRYYDRFRRAADGRWLYTERRVETRRPNRRVAG
jgi:ketosteroid isomerase-like protein